MWLPVGRGISGKAPVGCWPGLTPDSDPEKRLGLQVRNQEPQSQSGELWGQEAMTSLDTAPRQAWSTACFQSEPCLFPVPSKSLCPFAPVSSLPKPVGGLVLFAFHLSKAGPALPVTSTNNETSQS